MFPGKMMLIVPGSHHHLVTKKPDNSGCDFDNNYNDYCFALAKILGYKSYY